MIYFMILPHESHLYLGWQLHPDGSRIPPIPRNFRARPRSPSAPTCGRCVKVARPGMVNGCCEEWCSNNWFISWTLLLYVCFYSVIDFPKICFQTSSVFFSFFGHCLLCSKIPKIWTSGAERFPDCRQVKGGLPSAVSGQWWRSKLKLMGKQKPATES